MYLWDLSAYLPAGHLVIPMDSFAATPTWRDASYALARAGHRAASLGACQGRFEPVMGDTDSPWVLRGVGFHCWAWPAGHCDGACADTGAHAGVCACAGYNAGLTGPAPAGAVEQVPVEQVPVEQVPVEQVPGEQVPVEQVPAEQVPVCPVVPANGSPSVRCRYRSVTGLCLRKGGVMADCLWPFLNGVVAENVRA